MNEQLILKAAEEEFISKGYSGAKTTVIAQKAGVTHAMLHYYYRTKENLFKKVFQEKVYIIANSFEGIFDENLPFEEIVKAFVEKHFDFVMNNRGLVSFVYNEVRSNKENSQLLREILLSKMLHVFNRFETIIDREVAKGTIRAIKPMELFMNIITLNLSTSLFFSISGIVGTFNDPEQDEDLLKRKREDNVRLVLYSLRA
ncbi:MAG: TetR/AcrR family transcriptional regulator [Tannerella sp.]|jgi:AcrR family transcriptional regulator|nr:TetR/AcrR family transcriptional regulator [Tannerella sp.]